VGHVDGAAERPVLRPPAAGREHATMGRAVAGPGFASLLPQPEDEAVQSIASELVDDDPAFGNIPRPSLTISAPYQGASTVVDRRHLGAVADEEHLRSGVVGASQARRGRVSPPGLAWRRPGSSTPIPSPGGERQPSGRYRELRQLGTERAETRVDALALHRIAAGPRRRHS
jgi:hypothetical protein